MVDARITRNSRSARESGQLRCSQERRRGECVVELTGEVKGFGLEYLLQGGEVDDEELADEGESDRHDEHAVLEEAESEDRFGLRAARQRVEHVEEYKTGECHCRVARRHKIVDTHFAVKDEQRPEDDQGGGNGHVNEQARVNDGVFRTARALFQHVRVHGLDTEALSGGTIHEDVDPQDLRRGATEAFVAGFKNGCASTNLP